VALGLSLLLLGPTDILARARSGIPNHGRGIPSPVLTPAQREAARPVRISGTFEYSLHSGLTLGGQTVRVTTQTTIYPSPSKGNLFPDPGDLQGYRGTIYGRPGPEGVEAVLLILDRGSRYGVDTSGPNSQDLGSGSPAPRKGGDGVPQ
jgi:hypothetical protein